MSGLTRIDASVAPAGWLKHAVAYSLIIADAGLYAIAVGPGWRFSVRGRFTSELMVEAARRAGAELRVGDLASEAAMRTGSFFVAAGDLSNVRHGPRRYDRLPRLRFEVGADRYRFDVAEERSDELAGFAESLSQLAAMAPLQRAGVDGRTSVSGEAVHLDVEGESVTVVRLPAQCWGAAPYVSLADGRLFIEYLEPAEASHSEQSRTHRATDGEHADFVTGRTSLLAICQSVVRQAWGDTPVFEPDVWSAGRADTTRAVLRDAVGVRTDVIEAASRDLGRGGSGEQTARHERIRLNESERDAFDRALACVSALG